MRVPYKRYMTTAFIVGCLWCLNSINLLAIFFLENYSLLPYQCSELCSASVRGVGPNGPPVVVHFFQVHGQTMGDEVGTDPLPDPAGPCGVLLFGSLLLVCLETLGS